MSVRRDELLDKSVDYILGHGVHDLSLRPLSAAIGTKARLLIYHFGSRDALVAAALSHALRRVQGQFLAMRAEASLERTLLAFWRWATAKESEPYLRLVFEVHGLAPRHPRLYAAYVREAFESWQSILAQTLSRREKRELATLVMAVVDGLLLDYLATGDRARTTRALTLFTRTLRRKR